MAVQGLCCCARALSSCSEQELLSSCKVQASPSWLLLLWSMGSRARDLRLVTPWRMRSSQTRDQTCILCINRQILNHWTTREISVTFYIARISDSYLSFSVWLHFVWSSLDPSMLLQWHYFLPFYSWVLIHCRHGPCLLHPFICQWTFRLLPCPGYCK